MTTLKEFKEFLFRGNIVDLAVAVVIGMAFGKVVNSLVENLITPLIGVIGSKDYSELKFEINGSTFFWGVFLNDVIAFVSVAAAVFFFVVKPLARFGLAGKGEKEDS